MSAKEMLEMAGAEGVPLADLWRAGVAHSLDDLVHADVAWVTDDVAFARSVAVAKVVATRPQETPGDAS